MRWPSFMARGGENNMYLLLQINQHDIFKSIVLAAGNLDFCRQQQQQFLHLHTSIHALAYNLKTGEHGIVREPT